MAKPICTKETPAAGSVEVQRAADFLFDETTKLDAPISYIACQTLAKHILCGPMDDEQSNAADSEPAAWVNGDELDNLLDDRTTLIQGTQSGWRRTPLYRAVPQAVATPAFDALAAEVIDRISERYNKLAASPLGMATAWERKASGGKPLLYGGKRGLLASGTIATWDEFDLIADVINNLPTLLAACSVTRPKQP